MGAAYAGDPVSEVTAHQPWPRLLESISAWVDLARGPTTSRLMSPTSCLGVSEANFGIPIALKLAPRPAGTRCKQPGMLITARQGVTARGLEKKYEACH